MSVEAKGDSPSLDKDDDASAASIQSGIPKNSLETEAGISTPKGDGANVSTFMGEELEPFDDDVEAVIEKKLKFDKDKGLDVDSELDFELKWDDDADNTNDDQGKVKTVAKVDPELDFDDGESKTDKDPSKTKTNITVVDNVSAEMLNKEQKPTDQVNNDNPKVIEKPIDILDEVNVKASEDEAVSEENKGMDACNAENKVFLIDTNKKIDLESKTSSSASENSSLDERLVYSDVEVPDIEDKELMDELDAQICETDPNLGKGLEGDIVTSKTLVESESSPKECVDAGSSQQILSSPMDVDEVTKLDSEKENDTSDPNDTILSSNDLETSSYEINKEHKLKKPDVMLEIPTQEFIESFGDSEMSDEALEYDEDILLNNDATNNDPILIEGELPTNIETIDNLPKSIEVNDNNKDKMETVFDDRKIETDTVVNEQQDILKMEGNELEAKTSAMMEKVLLESNSDNDKSESKEVIRCDDNEIELMDVDAENEESHADIILEASHLEPNLTRKIEDISHKADLEPTDTLKAESIILPVAIATKYDTDVIKVSLPGHIEPQVSTLVDVEPEVATEQKETLYLADFEAKLLPEPMEIISTADTEPKVSVNATEAISASEVPTDVAVAKEIISTPDLLPKEDTKVAESNADEANLEKITVVKEVISTSDTPPKLEEMETTYAVEQEVATEVAEIKEVTSDEASSKEVMAVEEVSLDTLPEVVKEVDTTNGGIEPAMAIEATEVKEAASDEETPIKVPVVGVVSPIDAPLEVVKEVETTNTEAEPEVAKVVEEVAVADLQTKEVTEKEVVSKDAAQPSTSKYMQESSDEDQEVTDSLGLLAESSRVMDDDDEHEQDDEDDDDDFDQDDESNQMTAEHSEDSNAHQSETEVKEAMEVEEAAADKELQFQIAEVLSVADAEEAENEVTESREAIDDTEVETAVKSLLEIEDSKSNEETVASVTEATESATDDTDKLSDEPVNDEEAEGAASKLRELLTKDKADSAETVEPDKTSPSKTKKLEIAKPKNEINIVELEESSSEDDIQEVAKPSEAEEVTVVNIPLEVEVMSASAGAPSDMRRAEGEVVISGVPKPPPQKPARLNTGEVTIKTTAATTESLVIPETKISTPAAQDKPVLGLEIFSLDSDDDEKESAPKQLTAVEIDAARATSRCINVQCKSGLDPGPAGPAAVAYYGGRRGQVCRRCDMNVTSRGLSLIEGIKDFSPLLSLDMGQIREELVEISDSDSEEEISAAKMAEDAIGTKEADFLEEQLAAMFNRTWKKYGMDARLKAAESEISDEVSKLEEECTKINTMLNECQVATDKLRNDLYDTFAGERDELAPIMIYDTPTNTWCGLEEGIIQCENKETRQSKRRSSVAEPPAKRAAIPLGYAPLNSDANRAQNESKAASSTTDIAMQNDDDNCDISVVKLSAEAAPADLPPPGTASRPPLRAQMPVYAMRNAFGSWSKARILDVQPKVNGQFTMCRVKFEHKVKNPTKVLQARCLAYEHPSDVRMTIGTRLVALFKDNDNKRESYYSGIVAEIPNPVNNYRYLVFFDDGYAQYVQHSATRLVCECAPLVWDEVHPFSRQFVREYLCSYPERPMVRVHAGQSIRTEYNGKWWDSKVLQVDASLVQVHFDKENRTEWVYRGSTRLAPLYWELQAAERQRARPLPRAQPGKRFNMPYVEYTRSDDPAPRAVPSPAQIEQDIRRQRAVAKKSTSAPAQQPAPASLDGIASRVVFYTPKNAIKPNKMVPHTCSPKCKRTDVLALKDLRTYNPLTKPLLSGWERQIVKYKWSRSVMYRAPCGRRLRSQAELHRYLQLTGSDMPVDLFDFGPNTHCLAEFVLTKCRVSKKDLSHGKENVPVPCVNYYDDSLPEFCSYNTERTPTAGVPLNLDPEFLCGCDCTDDCADKSKCACWKMTLEGARTIGLHSDEVGYVYKRLPEPLPSGIYECNSRCKCRQTCLNRVAQHPLQLKLQVFKTLNRGWGIRALNDIPKGAFLCVYAGNLLTDATANLDGLNEGDEYLAELDYIEVVEQMKEGFEEDIPDADKKLDKKSSDQDDSTSTTSSSEEEEDPRNNADDDDFRPTLPLAHAPTEYTKRLRKRERTKKKEDVKEEKQKERDPNSEDTCITISDDEELREPARFAAQAGMGDKGFVSKYKSVRAHFGKDEACYIMDAKVQGNIGRYLNHSCTPNVFVQNVFVDTHDPRFPWVAFFALSHIRAGTELTWNYNYDVGSVPGKVLYCHCAAPNCRGRLL